MQQTAILNGRPVIVLSQMTQIETTQSRYTNMTSEIAQHFVRLGVTHIVIGALCIIFQIVSIAIATSGYSFVAHGIWTGCLFVVTGVLGILAGQKREKCQVIAFHALSTISIVFAAILLLIAGPSAASAFSESTQDQFVGGVVMETLLAALALTECFLSLSSSINGCIIGACCCNCGGSYCCPAESEYHQFDDQMQSDSAEEEFTSSNQPQPMMFNTSDQQTTFNLNQQQPVFNASQQQPVLTNQQRTEGNSNQQQLLCNTNQQHLMFSPNQQQPVFNPYQQQLMFNPYQLVFNPNQQQLVFSPNQQQVMVNPNQQQVMVNPNQQQVMVNQNQQQVMVNPNQQQVMVNPNQQQPLFHSNVQQTVFFPTQQTTGLFPLQQAVQFYAFQPNTTLNSQQSNFVSLPSGATGQEADGGSLSKLMTSNRPGEQPGNRGGNGSDEDPVYSDEAEVLPHEGPFGDSEERY